MFIYCNGVAVIEHRDTQETFEIHPEELELGTMVDGELSKGAETIYEASLKHDELGYLSWRVSEYPEGAQNFKETDVGDHQLVEDFDYGLADSSSQEPDPEHSPDWFKEAPRWAASLTVSTRVRLLVEWFYYYFEDPANETPYNSREGGYLYIHGGPYDAMDELSNTFGQYVSYEVLEAAVEKVQSSGIYDWAPSNNHADKAAYDEEAMVDHDDTDLPELSLEAIEERISAGQAPTFGSKEEQQLREQALQKIDELREVIPPSVEHGGMGHNKPPEEFALQEEDLAEVQSSLDDIEAELKAENPNVEKVVEKASVFRRIIGWVARKADIAIEEFCKGFGSTLGKAAGGLVPVGMVIVAFWDKFGETFLSILSWLNILFL